AGMRLNYCRGVPDALRLSAASPGQKEFLPRRSSPDKGGGGVNSDVIKLKKRRNGARVEYLFMQK
ncbi:hypothetical protein, partial [Escherichia coli]